MRLRIVVALFVLISFFVCSLCFAADLDSKRKRVAGATWLRGVPCGWGYGPDPDGTLNNALDWRVMAGDYAFIPSADTGGTTAAQVRRYWWWFQGN